MISYMTLIVKLFQAKDLPALEEDAANVFSKSERILLDHATKRFKNAPELKELIQEVLHHPDFDLDSVDHNLHERLLHFNLHSFLWGLIQCRWRSSRTLTALS